MHQFFVDSSQITADQVTITGSDVNHIRNVLRMRCGEIIRISDQNGQDCLCEVTQIKEDYVLAAVTEEKVKNTELSARIYLFQALPKGDRMETVIEKCVELGVYEIIPVVMKYCVVKLDEKKAANKVKRWQAIAESAAKQSKRSRIPQIHEVMTYQQALEYANQMDVRMVPYENERGMEATREAIAQVKSGSTVSIIVGPEGGFADEEIARARENMQSISLGSRILRTDTAGMCLMSLLMMHLELDG